MNIGDIMVEKNGPHGGYLACGSGSYSAAILVSVDPFVMVSPAGDMMWTVQKPENFVSKGPATAEQTRAAFDRYVREGGKSPFTSAQQAKWLSDDLKELLAENEKLDRAKWDAVAALAAKRNAAIRTYILEGGLLQTCTWHLSYRGENKDILLSAEEYSDNPKLKELASLTETDYHSTFVVEEIPPAPDADEYDLAHPRALVELHYDDGEVRITFKDQSYVPTFIKKYSLTVKTTGIDDSIANLCESIAVLEALKARVIP